MAFLTETELDVSNFATVEGGECSFHFDAPPAGMVYTGVLYVPEATAAATFQATRAGKPYGQWTGNQGFGPAQTRANQPLDVFGFGFTLPAGTPVTLRWYGWIASGEQIPYAVPTPTTTTTTVAPPGVTTYADLDAAGWVTYADLDDAFSVWGDIPAYRAVRTL